MDTFFGIQSLRFQILDSLLQYLVAASSRFASVTFFHPCLSYVESVPVLHPAAKCASVFLLSTVKFLGGPLAGSSMGMSFWPTLALTVGGMMTSVFVISGVGRKWVRHRQQQRRLRRQPVFSKRSRNIIKVFKKFGMGGIAFLTPILLSPVGGTVIATLLGVPRQRIMLHMLWSAVLWGGVLTMASSRIQHLLHH